MTDVESAPLCCSHIHVFEKCAFGFEANPSAATASCATAAPDNSRGAVHTFGKEEPRSSEKWPLSTRSTPEEAAECRP